MTARTKLEGAQVRAPDQRVPELAARDPRIPLDLGAKRTAILRVAFGELDRGVKEEPPGSNRGPRVDLYIPSWARTRPGPPWCAWFATWVLEQALGDQNALGRTGGTSTLTARAQAADLWRPKAGYLPSPGDLFMMRMSSSSGHVGFVAGGYAGRIETVEGNSGDRVRHGVRSLDDARIIGFVCTVPEEPYLGCWWTGQGEDVSGAGTR